ncbi:MAG: hypothetical protein K2M90_09530 [Treponemataceae bacterium]|nr:hypothetical protein [Treponemataceae bacterium]MDE7392682.1 hypothetical protein [Treponemataceae bacterium]
MMKLNAKKTGMALCALAALTFTCMTGCKASASGEIELGDDKEQDNLSGSADITDGIDYKSDANGTLTIRNNTTKDMVLFEGETPTKDTILGGVRAQSSRAFDVSGKNDFAVGGWMIIKGMGASEYTANKANLTKAKVEYSTMATYHAGEYYEATINAAYTGDYCIKVSNNGKIGIELHKDSFNGEKIAYLSPYKSNQYIYFDDNKSIRLYPVYVYYSTRNHTVSTLSGDFFESRTVVPASVTESYMQTYSFPADPNTTWSQIMENISFPTAYITVTNGVEEGAYFKIGSAQYVAQNGQDAVGGVPVTFEVVSTKDGEEKQITLALYNGNVSVPVLTADGGIPTIQNGYDYSVSLTKVALGNTPAILADPNSYKAVISDGTLRDIKSEIETLPQQ